MVSEKVNAILISPFDDVATAIVEFRACDIGRCLKNGETLETAITESIPKYHKFAVRDIAQGEYVRKYGEAIGVATQNIKAGSHVHEHNIASPEIDTAKA